MSAPPGSWNDVSNVAVDDSAVATPVMPCAYLACEVVRPTNLVTDNTFTHEMTLSGLGLVVPADLAASGLDANSITALRLVVKGQGRTSSRLPAAGPLLQLHRHGELPGAEMHVRVELRTADGRGVASPRAGFVNSAQEIAFDLLDVDVEDPTAPNCNALVLAELR